MDKRKSPWSDKPILDWAVELQALAQTGLAYGRDPYDIERFERIREISAQMMSFLSEEPLEKVKELFCNETGFQTPKLDSRGAIIENGRILLVQERDGKWSLPGGWVDVNQSLASNTVKEVKEEAGLDVEIVKLVAIQDKNLRNPPVRPYGITKAFFLCRVLGGCFVPNLETVDSGWFQLDKLPPLSLDKITEEQIGLCFQAAEARYWEPPVD